VGTGRFMVQKAVASQSTDANADSSPSPANSSPYTTASESGQIPSSAEVTTSLPKQSTSPSLSIPDSVSSISTTGGTSNIVQSTVDDITLQQLQISTENKSQLRPLTLGTHPVPHHMASQACAEGDPGVSELE
jgi:hypothetical protein